MITNEERVASIVIKSFKSILGRDLNITPNTRLAYLVLDDEERKYILMIINMKFNTELNLDIFDLNFISDIINKINSKEGNHVN